MTSLTAIRVGRTYFRVFSKAKGSRSSITSFRFSGNLFYIHFSNQLHCYGVPQISQNDLLSDVFMDIFSRRVVKLGLPEVSGSFSEEQLEATR